MLLNLKTIPNKTGVRIGAPFIRIREKKIAFSMSALKEFGVTGPKLFIQFKYENNQLFAIVGPDKDAFVSSINAKTKQCSLGNRELIAQILKLTQSTENVDLKVNPAIERRHEGWPQFPLIKI